MAFPYHVLTRNDLPELDNLDEVIQQIVNFNDTISTTFVPMNNKDLAKIVNFTYKQLEGSKNVSNLHNHTKQAIEADLLDLQEFQLQQQKIQQKSSLMKNWTFMNW